IAKNTSWSAGPPSAPESPSTDVAPSTLAIMLRRTAGRPLALGRSAYTSRGSTGSAATGNSWRMTLRVAAAQHVPAPAVERQSRGPLVGGVDEVAHPKDSAVEGVGVPAVALRRGFEVRGEDIQVGLRDAGIAGRGAERGPPGVGQAVEARVEMLGPELHAVGLGR